ncbi:chaperone NapD [Aliarcobacter butzleri]|uniref:Chaperone NapD n=5 Tax=Aliarcobacter butzleri TaxID=28197 RepID=A8ERQ3_ALIB4|nr:chaperone NapD [Aliarcobacter butzleri]ABV66627.1 putative periplasmic nitrate reductase assembly protein NapD [Aliarcobacter butzleri RM4018]AGR76677.1 periplasmic nitrate reductase assembly protein [Aliarcobacter butzleri 7h1h]EFU70743.1 periplasmic nitrate reductase NapD [Aliarcobacter butzleri JV22]KLD99824.1 nitrate reductase [Aliarcobacter butzleri L348]KLE03212.1 nitrate reductase [Aliarcobacter butzleri L352]
MNISSIVVQTLPKNLEEVVKALKASGVCDYFMHDELGRIIVTIEGDGVQEELKKLKVIEAIPNVISADMQMAYSQEELDSHLEVLENSDAVPRVLNEDVKPEDIVYNGDLKQKDLIGFATNFDKTGK